MAEWWEGVPTDDFRDWWEGLPVDPPEITSIELQHPTLRNKSIVLIRSPAGVWQVTSCNWTDGRQTDPIMELVKNNLMVEGLNYSVPVLVKTKASNYPEVCPDCISEDIQVLQSGSKYFCKCLDCERDWVQ